MKFSITSVMLVASLAAPLVATAQSTSPDQTTTTDRPESWKRIIPNTVDDQKRVWSFPAKVAHGQSWIPVTAALGVTAALLALDPTEASYFRGTSSFRGANHVWTSNATAIGTIAVPVSLYATGLIRKDSKMQQTALLAGEAVLDSEIVTTVLKDVTKRVRPAGFPPHGNLYDSWFESSGSPLRGDGSFPSGHTIAAFSVATVIARRYGNHKWVPYVAYGAAALVGFSRLCLSAHFSSDVFMGAALGYSISRFAVLRQ
jgi:membrane-associated phospholipid phosphatase